MVARRALRSEKFEAILNATPVGMYPHSGISPLSAGELNCRIAMDLIYRPMRAEFLKIAARKGDHNGFGSGNVSSAGIRAMGNVDGEESAGGGDAAGDFAAIAVKKSRRRRGKGARVIQPSFREFERLAKQGNLVPVYDVFSADLLTPVSAYLRIAQGARYSFLLESVEGGRKSRGIRLRGRIRRKYFGTRTGRACWRGEQAGVGRERSGEFLRQADGEISSGAIARAAAAGGGGDWIFQL